MRTVRSTGNDGNASGEEEEVAAVAVVGGYDTPVGLWWRGGTHRVTRDLAMLKVEALAVAQKAERRAPASGEIS